MKQGLSLFLILALTVCLLAGCAAGPAQSSAPGALPEAADPAARADMAPAALPEPENPLAHGADPRLPAAPETEAAQQATQPARQPEARQAFTDLVPGAFYTEAVEWAVENGVTNGMTPTTFGPAQTCTRGQVVTFLWRSRRSPVPAAGAGEFEDVAPGAFYAPAVAWAVETAVTNGVGPNLFGPDRPCTRGQVVTFLWRARGCPEPASTDAPFTDADPSAFYYKAMCWAVERRITNGMSATSFAPNATCTRGQIVTFLFRDFAAELK